MSRAARSLPWSACLACPDCRSPLRPAQRVCAACGARFPRRHGYPLLLPSSLPEDMRQSIEAWNKEWAKLRGPALKERRDEYHRDYLDDTLRQLLAWIDPRRHRRFLEIGCGPAILGEALARRGFQVAGLDCCIEALKAAGRVHRGLRRPSFFVGGDLNHIPLRDGSVDFLYGGGSSSISTTPWGVCASCIASWRRGVCLSTRSPIFPLAA